MSLKSSALRLTFLLCAVAVLLFISSLPARTANADQSETRPRTVQAQKPSEPQDPAKAQEDVVRLSSRLVLVPVSVSDASGKPVRDLRLEDFVLSEEGKPQKVVTIGEPGKTPVDIALLFDVSGSVHGQFEFEQQSAVRFIKQVLKPTDAVSVFSIGTTPALVRARTTRGDEAMQGVMSLAPVKAATAFFDSIVHAAIYVGQGGDPGSRRVLVVISDGEENYSKQNTQAAALRELQKNDCLFYSINPTGTALSLNVISEKGQRIMEALSEQTGGKAFVPARIEDLDAVFQQIADELQAQYLLGYYSTDERADGGFRRISVQATGRGGLRVRARMGYYAPKA
jgi:Ca-activated chloride channel family protein